MLRLAFRLAFGPVHTAMCCCSCSYSCCCCCCYSRCFSVSSGATGRASSTEPESLFPSEYVCTHSSSASDVVVSGSVSPAEPAPQCGGWWRLHHTGKDCSPTRSKRLSVSLVGVLVLFTAFSCATIDSSWNSLLKDSSQFLEVGSVTNRVGTPILWCSDVPGSILLLYTSWVWLLGKKPLFLQTEITPVSIVAGFAIRGTSTSDLSFFESVWSAHNSSPRPKPILFKTTEPGLYHILQSRFLIFMHNFLAYGSKTPVLGYSSQPPASPSHRFTRNVETIMVPLYGSPNRGYCAMIAIGSVDVQQFCVLVDTGSSNLAIAATAQEDITQHFNISSADASLRDLGSDVSVSYTGGEWSGRLATDIVSMIDAQDTRQSTYAYIALIQSSKNFFIRGTEWEGIMGLAYPSLAKPDSSVEPYWDTMRKARGMSDVFSLQLCPPIGQNNSRENKEQGGQLILGGHGGSAYTGSIFYTSIVHEDFYRVLITNMSVGGVKVDVHCREFNNDKAIVDSGTTDIYLATDAFEAVLNAFLEYMQDLTSIDIPAGFWSGDSKLALNSSSLHRVYTTFPTLYIAFASHENQTQEFSLGVTPQLYLRQVQGSATEQTCQPTCDFFEFGIKQRSKGTVIGGNVMLGFATVFDREAGRIGFATSTCQYQDNSNETLPFIIGYYPRDMMDCRCVGCSGQLVRLLTQYFIGIIAAIIILVLVTLITVRTFRSYCKHQQLCCSHCAQGKQISEEEKAEEEVVEGEEETCGSVDNRGICPSDLSVTSCATSEQSDTSNHIHTNSASSASRSSSLVCGSAVQSASGSSNLVCGSSMQSDTPASDSSNLVCGSSMQSDTPASGSSNLVCTSSVQSDTPSSNFLCGSSVLSDTPASRSSNLVCTSSTGSVCARSTLDTPTSSNLSVTMCASSEFTVQSGTSTPDGSMVQSKSSATVSNNLNEVNYSTIETGLSDSANTNMRNMNMRNNNNASVLQEPDHDLSNNENEHASTRQQSKNFPSIIMSWIKREGFSFIRNLKSKVTRKDKSKSLLIMQCEDVESLCMYSQEINNTSPTGASNYTEHAINPQDSVDDSAHLRTDDGHDLHGQNTTTQDKFVVGKRDASYPKLALSESTPQHNSMMGIGDKSSYCVDDSYPKLALSESPLGSLTGSLDIRLEGDTDKNYNMPVLTQGLHAASAVEETPSHESCDSATDDQPHATASDQSDLEIDTDKLVDSKILPGPETILDNHLLPTLTPHNLMSETNTNSRGNYTQKPSQNTTKQQARDRRRRRRHRRNKKKAVSRSALVDRDRVFPLISEERQNLLNNS